MVNKNILDESFNLILEILSTAIEASCFAIYYKKNNSSNFKLEKYSYLYDEESFKNHKCKNLKVKNNDLIFEDINSEMCPCLKILNRIKEFLEIEEVKEVYHITDFGSFYRNKTLSFDNSYCSSYQSLSFIPIKKPFYENSAKINGNTNYENNNVNNDINNNLNKEDEKNLSKFDKPDFEKIKGFFNIIDKRKNIFNENNISKIERISIYFTQLLNDIETILTYNFYSKFKILFVEDNYDVKNIINKLLQRIGFTTIPVSNGREALDIIKKDKIDLVITDITMPYVNGLELIKQCYEKYEQYGPKFIILTTYDYLVTEDFKDRYNVFSVLSKPLTDIKVLKETIENALIG
jgi:CheY-like chemotaxis protein